MPQSWQCEIEVYKATYHFIYAQKNFFTGEVSSVLKVKCMKLRGNAPVSSSLITAPCVISV